MRFFKFFLANVLSAILYAGSDAGSALAAETQTEGPYPVWWEPVIELTGAHNAITLDRLEVAVRYLSWKFPGDWTAEVYLDGDRTKEMALIDDCASYHKLTDAGYIAAVRYVAFNLDRMEAFCRTVELLSHVVPAKKSFLHDFVFDEKSLNYLPALSYSPVSGGVRCMAYFANRARVPLKQFLRRVLSSGYQKIEMTGGKRIELFHTNNDSDPGAWIGLLARGDFNHDGLEDILVRSGYSFPHTSYEEIFVLSRDAPDAVLYVLDAERHIRYLYSGEGCDHKELSWDEHMENWKGILDHN